jgi:hypothetical protein
MMQLDRMKQVALLTEVSGLTNGKELPFEAYVTWEDVDSAKEHHSGTVNSVLQVVSTMEAENTKVNIEVVRKFADIWEASLAYRGMILNERNDFRGASMLYKDNLDHLSMLVSSLDDGDSRINRHKLAGMRMGREWSGRSKRESFDLAKKCMKSEPNLRQEDFGNWHDRLSI